MQNTITTLRPLLIQPTWPASRPLTIGGVPPPRRRRRYAAVPQLPYAAPLQRHCCVTTAPSLPCNWLHRRCHCTTAALLCYSAPPTRAPALLLHVTLYIDMHATETETETNALHVMSVRIHSRYHNTTTALPQLPNSGALLLTSFQRGGWHSRG